MRAPSRLSKEEKAVWRDLVSKLVDLKHFHGVDVYQLEMACCMIVENRELRREVAQADVDQDGITLRKLYFDSCTKVNSICDKLGISYTKRNMKKEARGRPEKGRVVADQKEQNDWLTIINSKPDVPITDPARRTN